VQAAVSKRKAVLALLLVAMAALAVWPKMRR